MLKKILISQPKPTSDKSPYFEIARKFGVEFVFHPFIKVEGLTAREFRQQKCRCWTTPPSSSTRVMPSTISLRSARKCV